MARNVFILGMDGFNLDTMRGLREAPRYDFHPLLPSDALIHADEYDIDALVAQADAELRAFGGAVDGISTWWDFPSSCLSPILSERFDCYGPSLKSVVVLEHKYWSRLAQRAVAGEHVPAFAAFDPFDDDALDKLSDRGVHYPFWIKPVKSVASYLGFRIDGPDDWDPAIATMREEIGQFGDPFDQVMERVPDLPADVEAIGGSAVLAEGIIGGWQCTLEGFVSHGEPHVYGVVDSLRVEGRSTFRAYHYPSQLPVPIQRRMMQIASEVVLQAGLDHCCFNAEFYYDEDSGQIWILEVNTRLSQSHCDLFEKVDGASSQRALLDLTQGRMPRMLHRQGPFAAAGKHFLRTTQDGVVRAVPSADDIAAVQERFPGTRVDISLEVGTRLSDMAVQETYSYELGRVFIGAEDHEQLEASFAEIERMLPFDIER